MFGANCVRIAQASPMIRQCTHDDLSEIESIINDASQAYKSVIPPDRWHEPYMPLSELIAEVRAGVNFWGWEEDGLKGVMGIQCVRDAHLIRHAYVRTSHQGKGVGGVLLAFLIKKTPGRLLVGTWAAANWAIRFYERRGFRLVAANEKDRLLETYWNIPKRQKETSVVLVREDPPASR